MGAVTASLAPELGDADLQVTHTMPCDHNAEKRALVRTMVGPSVMLGAAQELVAREAANYAAGG